MQVFGLSASTLRQPDRLNRPSLQSSLPPPLAVCYATYLLVTLSVPPSSVPPLHVKSTHWASRLTNVS